MKSEPLILSLLNENSGKSAEQLSKDTRLVIGHVRYVLRELLSQGLVERDRQYRYLLPQSSSPAALRFLACSEKAAELEKGRHWRRAARVWLEAFDSTRNPQLRTRAAARRDHCIAMGNLNCGNYGGISGGVMNSQSTWEDLNR